MAKKKKEKKRTFGQEVLSWIGSFAIAVVIALLLRNYVFSLIRVEGTSMLETLQNNDRLYVSILSARMEGYEQGDIVICCYPGADHQSVKRVIGLPGDRVEIIEGTVYVNGEALEETYVTYGDQRSMAEMMLAEGEYFLLGDNRPVSKDSRDVTVGAVTDIVGKARWILWPLDRIGRVK